MTVTSFGQEYSNSSNPSAGQTSVHGLEHLETAASLLGQFKNGVGRRFCSKEKILPVFLVDLMFMRRLRVE